MSKTVEYTAAGGVVIHDGCMLLLGRPDRNEIRLPKGHVDPGERHDQTALRETVEETGYADLVIVADLDQQVVEYDYAGQHYRRTEHYFLMRKQSDGRRPRPPRDDAQFRPFWVDAAQAPGLLTYPAERAVAQRALAAYQATRI